MAQEMLNRPDLYPKYESPIIDDKESGGSSLSPSIDLVPATCPPTADTLPANWNQEKKQGTCTTNASSIWSEKCPKFNCWNSSVPESGANSPMPLHPTSTPSKIVPTLNPSGLNLGKKSSKGTTQQTGNSSTNKHLKELLKKSQLTSAFAITSLSDESTMTLYDLLSAHEELIFSGVQLVLVKPNFASNCFPTLILKIHATSGSTVTQIKKLLLSMNFVETYQFPTCFDGVTNGFLYYFRPKADTGLLWHSELSSLQTSCSKNGIPILIPKLFSPLRDE